MSTEEEFADRMEIDIKTLHAWLNDGWIVPHRIKGKRVFRDVDEARAHLIHDLDELMGVNGEGIEVVLELIDQLNMLRRDFDKLLEALRATQGASGRPDRKYSAR